MIKKKKAELVPETDGKLRYKKISGGIHNHRDGQVVRKGEILYAMPEELSDIAKEGFKCLDDEAKAMIGGGIGLEIKHRGNGWFDIINKATGDKLNDQALRAKDAKEFLEGDSAEKDAKLKELMSNEEEEEPEESEESEPKK